MNLETSSEVNREAEKRLPSAANLIFGLWIVLVVFLVVWFRSINANAGDWEQSANLMMLVFLFIGFVVVGLSWLFARFVAKGHALKVLNAVFGPPIIASLVPLFIWITWDLW